MMAGAEREPIRKVRSLLNESALYVAMAGAGDASVWMVQRLLMNDLSRADVSEAGAERAPFRRV